MGSVPFFSNLNICVIIWIFVCYNVLFFIKPHIVISDICSKLYGND